MGRTVKSSISGTSRNVSDPHNVETTLRSTQSLHQRVAGAKRPEHETDHSPGPSAKV
jgi:hypothetical protein